MNFRFKQEFNDVNIRKQNCDKIRNQYPDKIPVICEKDPKSKTLQDIDKTKYLVPNDLTVAQFSFMIRERLQLDEKEAFFLLAAGKYSISGETRLNEVYNKFSDKDDGYLYVAYASKETWGNN